MYFTKKTIIFDETTFLMTLQYLWNKETEECEHESTDEGADRSGAQVHPHHLRKGFSSHPHHLFTGISSHPFICCSIQYSLQTQNKLSLFDVTSVYTSVVNSDPEPQGFDALTVV
jgi:hypothetical protein